MSRHTRNREAEADAQVTESPTEQNETQTNDDASQTSTETENTTSTDTSSTDTSSTDTTSTDAPPAASVVEPGVAPVDDERAKKLAEAKAAIEAAKKALREAQEAAAAMEPPKSMSDASYKALAEKMIGKAKEKLATARADAKTAQDKVASVEAELQSIEERAQAGTLRAAVVGERTSTAGNGDWADNFAKAQVKVKERMSKGETPFKAGSKRQTVHELLTSGTNWGKLKTVTGWDKSILQSFTYQISKLTGRDLVRTETGNIRYA